MNLNEMEFDALLAKQILYADRHFNVGQQERLSELMTLWRSARDRGQELPPEQQAELNDLVELELQAATTRTEGFIQSEDL